MDYLQIGKNLYIDPLNNKKTRKSILAHHRLFKKHQNIFFDSNNKKDIKNAHLKMSYHERCIENLISKKSRLSKKDKFLNYKKAIVDTNKFVNS